MGCILSVASVVHVHWFSNEDLGLNSPLLNPVSLSRSIICVSSLKNPNFLKSGTATYLKAERRPRVKKKKKMLPNSWRTVAFAKGKKIFPVLLCGLWLRGGTQTSGILLIHDTPEGCLIKISTATLNRCSGWSAAQVERVWHVASRRCQESGTGIWD